MSKQDHETAKIKACLDLIEIKLAWGKSDKWNTHDFEKLSALIEEETSVLLSITTLKRIWGKIKYDSSPNVKTLDTLAQFAGENSWRELNQEAVVAIRHEDTPLPFSNFSLNVKRIGFGLIAISLLGVIGFFAFSLDNINPKIDAELFAFESRVVSNGFPNSVIFKYDATMASPEDTIQLQQNWDSNRRQYLSPTDTIATSIYYTPGFFESKLVINNQVIKEHNLYLPSEGWLGIIDQSPTPIYLSNDEIHLSTDIVGIPLTAISINDIDLKYTETQTSLYNVQELENITTDDFIMTTSVKNDSKIGINSCQFVELLLYCEGKVILSTLSIPGCISNNNTIVLEQNINGKNNDMSGFGTSFDDWVDVRWESRNDTISFYTNDNLAFQYPIDNKANRIMGIRYRFQGVGSVRSLYFSNSQEVVYDLLSDNVIN